MVFEGEYTVYITQKAAKDISRTSRHELVLNIECRGIPNCLDP